MTGRRERRGAAGPSHVYLAVLKPGPEPASRRFKIGVARDPQARLAALPEAQAIDYAASLKCCLPTPERARAVEAALHKALRPLRVPPGHAGDGHTEWFDSAGLVIARTILEAVPDSIGPWTAPPEPAAAVHRRAEPAQCRAVLRRVRGVWLRLAQLGPLKVVFERGSEPARLVLPGLRAGPLAPGHLLRLAAMGNDGVYALPTPPQPGVAGAPRSLVARIEFGGPAQQDLCIVLQPSAQLLRRADGAALVDGLKALLRALAALERQRTQRPLALHRLRPIGLPGQRLSRPRCPRRCAGAAS